MSTLADCVTHGRNNSFNLIRMLAASAVLFSHAFPLAFGPDAVEPLTPTLHFSLGELAVYTFFAISGFFISQSFDRRRDALDFWTARVLRIYPALMIALVISAFVLGPALTSLSTRGYFSSADTYLYVPRGLSLKWTQNGLPGLFLTNPYGPAVNGSLWTLFYEVACYAMVAVIGLMGLRFFTAFLCVYGAAYVVLRFTGPHALLIDHFRELSLPFVAGMTFFHFREKMKLWWLAVGALGLVVLGHQREIFILAWSSLAILAGYLPWGMFYNRLGDYSYGIYIYAFPVEQSVAHVLKPIPPLPLAIISFSFTGALAVLSWHIIEHRSLLIRPMLRGAIMRIYARAWLLHRVPSAPSHRRSA